MTINKRNKKIPLPIKARGNNQVSNRTGGKILQDNRTKGEKAKVDLRRKTLVGEMFLKHFPIAMDFTPGKSSAEDDQILKPLDDFMEALSKCQQCYQAMEDALLKSR